VLTADEIRAHLARLTYRPGWAFELYEGRFEGLHLRITATVDDSLRPGETVVLGVNSRLPWMADSGQLESWLAHRLAAIEVHEMREWLKRDGEAIFDPHAEGAGEDRLA
jgi:hypothetical protein